MNGQTVAENVSRGNAKGVFEKKSNFYEENATKMRERRLRESEMRRRNDDENVVLKRGDLSVTDKPSFVRRNFFGIIIRNPE